MTAKIISFRSPDPLVKHREALNAIVNAMKVVDECARKHGFIGGDNMNRLAYALVAAHGLLEDINEPPGGSTA